tara:strand:+ start:12827 stop:13108 length:282 start_codon:yes stop_codon:yes gene_type:complete
MKNFYQITNYLFNYFYMFKNISYFLFTKFLNKKLISEVKFLNKKLISEVKFFKRSFKLKSQQLNIFCKEIKKIKQKIILNYELINLKNKLMNI